MRGSLEVEAWTFSGCWMLVLGASAPAAVSQAQSSLIKAGKAFEHPIGVGTARPHNPVGEAPFPHQPSAFVRHPPVRPSRA
jgi:hypothetical protein